MKLTIIGGSKGTGAELATVAMDADHDVTVVSRSGTGPAGATIVTADASAPADSGTLRDALAGADAVVVTVGGAKGVKNARATITRSVISAMAAAGVRRLVVQSSLAPAIPAPRCPPRCAC
nr:NAD(P)H-binding protein [Corynebacterium xerosis]